MRLASALNKDFIIAQKVFRNSTITIRLLKESDLEDVAKLEERLFSSPWSTSSFRNELDNTVSTTYVLSCENLIIGYATFWIVADEMQITKIAVVPAFRNLGIATWTMELILQKARILNVSHAFIEVRQSNAGAIRLYEKLGFTRQAIRADYYTSPKEDAFVMAVHI